MTQYTVGKIYTTDGLDNNCQPVKIKVTLWRLLDKVEQDEKSGRYDCVVKCEDNIRVFSKLSNLSV